ncbi:thiol:disulfide interchange protein TlpA [Microvirga roseola]|uniref:thiol:disulfide interchange protein TlpA n=1 Tax=Microvirga roseola TaxID=2883126 RepID=UPI002AC36069|nr:redoxin domain-containing protein [Microvirga roseola]
MRTRTLLAGVVALGLIGAGAAWYGLSQRGAMTAEAAECRASAPVAERLEPLAKGELAAVGVSASPKQPPAIAFTGPDGQPTSLERFGGKTVLVNLWATWCVPCRQEMPALDKLQAELGGRDFEVVAINVDTRNPDKPKAWLEENGIRNLAYYADPAGKLLQTLQRSGHVVGLPTTFIVDPAGCEVAILKGPAEWASPDALVFMRTALGRS